MTITVKIIADSISPQGVRLTTFELEYPRYIHAEIMTHRVFSRNAQSSRAVPVNKSLEQAIISPITWGKNKAGMAADETLDESSRNECAYYWNALARYAQDFCGRMSKAGLHKQWANRPLEWFSNIKVVITATEWENFFWLRDDPDAAQPEIVELARQMKAAMDTSKPQLLQPGEWHLPYIESNRIFGDGYLMYWLGGVQLDLETAKKISASCCAQVSYRKLDTSIEKALEIYDKLFSGPKPHLSPVEHQATPMGNSTAYVQSIDYPGDFDYLSPYAWEHGTTHMGCDGSLFSGNLRGWIQQRQVM